jgi:hypothetical protein
MALFSPADWYVFFTGFRPFKVEAAALGEIKLVDIEFKKHDPHKIIGNHMASCNLKRYEHEDSPQDEMFSRSKVLSRGPESS